MSAIRRPTRALHLPPPSTGWVGLATALAVFCAPAPALAHFVITDPAPRVPGSTTNGPCGASMPGAARTTLRPGQTVNIQWDLSVPHGGSFRVAFSPNDDAGFEDYILATGPEYPDVLAQELEIVLPACGCDECTLQVWQVLGSGGGYYACANIELVPADGQAVDPCPAAEIEEAGSSDGAGTGGEAGGEGGGLGEDGSGSGSDGGAPPNTGGGTDGTGTGTRAMDSGGPDPGGASGEGGSTVGCAVATGTAPPLTLLWLLGLVRIRRGAGRGLARSVTRAPDGRRRGLT